MVFVSSYHGPWYAYSVKLVHNFKKQWNVIFRLFHLISVCFFRVSRSNANFWSVNISFVEHSFLSQFFSNSVTVLFELMCLYKLYLILDNRLYLSNEVILFVLLIFLKLDIVHYFYLLNWFVLSLRMLFSDVIINVFQGLLYLLFLL